MKKPIIAIIGRPNVGKSTLFNRLIGWRMAIVEDLPGVTRDRNYAEGSFGGRSFTLEDTGGLVPGVGPEDTVVSQIKAQTQRAIEEADVLIALYDGRQGITPLDQEIMAMLRQLKKPVFHAVNKIDTPKSEPLAAEFYRLGVKTIFPISSDHGLGIAELMEAVLPPLSEAPEEASGTDVEDDAVPRVAVVGRPNVGKSTLVNALLGEERLLTDATPGTTRDAIDSRVEHDGRIYHFIDTAGIRRRGKIVRGVERYSIVRAQEAVARCNIAVIVLDAEEGIVEQDTKVIGDVVRARKGCIILMNKWDLRKGDTKGQARIETELKRRLTFIPFAPVLFISALQGPPVGEIFERIDRVMAAYSFRVS
ncbi:MAG TPA: ribosome biogenesis GTPase Der, partial [Nitrospiria bacterium]